MPHEGVDMKLVYELATKVRVSTFSFRPGCIIPLGDFIRPVARHRVPKHQIEHDIREHRRGTVLHFLRRVCFSFFLSDNVLSSRYQTRIDP